MIVALFDSDGTLYSNQMGRGMIKYAEENGDPRAGKTYFASLFPSYVLSKLKIMKPERFQNIVMNGLTRYFEGLDLAEGTALFKWVANEYLLTSKREDVEKRLKGHLAQGHKVIIVSGAFSPCLEFIGEHFQVADLIGTQIEVRDGRYTGNIIPPLISGAVKVKKVRELLSARGVEADWASSYAYGDSFSDRELLGMVGHPVAVYPDMKLHALAKKMDWEVLGTPRE